MDWKEIISDILYLCGINLTELSKETGLSITYLFRLKDGSIKEPTYDRGMKILINHPEYIEILDKKLLPSSLIEKYESNEKIKAMFNSKLNSVFTEKADAHEFFKINGIEKVKEILSFAKDEDISYRNGKYNSKGCTKTSVLLFDLKKIVEAHEFIEKNGGLEHLKKSIKEKHKSQKLKQAIKDVEQCL